MLKLTLISPEEYARKNIIPQFQQPLHPVYKDSVQEFLWDFWSDMPWTPERSSAVASFILQDEELRHIVRAFDVKYQIPDESRIEVGMMVYATGNFD